MVKVSRFMTQRRGAKITQERVYYPEREERDQMVAVAIASDRVFLRDVVEFMNPRTKKIYTAFDAAKGLELARKFGPYAVIIDEQLMGPEMSIALLRSVAPNSRIVVVTDRAISPEAARDSIKSGAAYLSKADLDRIENVLSAMRRIDPRGSVQ
jgi:ActR/RegA family two-component response regulator